jgi:DnaJ-class molecular chaperone
LKGLTVGDPYKTLGVPRDATSEAIRSAYRKLAKQHHPDLNPGNGAAEERFKAIASAYGLLSDAAQRARFDRGEIDASGAEQRPHPNAHSGYRAHAESSAGQRYRHAGPEADEWNDPDLEAVFASMFAGGRDGPRAEAAQYRLAVPLLDAVNGATKRLTLPDQRVLDVKIPPGTEAGHILRLRGQATKVAAGSKVGDILIEIAIEPDPLYTREEQTLRLELPVTLSEAVLGGPVEIGGPRGALRLRIPPHSDTGTELRVRGRGVPAHDGKPEGDLYVRLRVMVGPGDPALDAFLQTWQPVRPFNPRQTMDSAS